MEQRRAPATFLSYREIRPAARQAALPRYDGHMVQVERVQTGVRIERHLLKVLKGVAEYLDISLGNLIEGVMLHAFEQARPFDEATLTVIKQLKQVYGLELTAADSHAGVEIGEHA
jgi:hypothetical protein